MCTLMKDKILLENSKFYLPIGQDTTRPTKNLIDKIHIQPKTYLSQTPRDSVSNNFLLQNTLVFKILMHFLLQKSW